MRIIDWSSDVCSSDLISDDALFSATSREQQKGYVLANLRLDWNNVMGNPIDASLFVKNLFDKTYKIGSGNLISSQLGTTSVIYGDPRIYGLQKIGRASCRERVCQYV